MTIGFENSTAPSDPVNLSNHLIYRPGVADVRKHSFDPEFFNSEKCKALTKVFVDESVELCADGGQHLLFAKCNIKKGQIIERSVLRPCDGLDDKVPNRFIFRVGTDFSPDGLELKFDAPYLAAGSIMFYATSTDNANVELKMAHGESNFVGKGSLEVEVVAVEDINAGARLVRKGAEIPVDIQYADVYNMSDDALDAWFKMWAANDLEDAEKAEVEPEKLHEATIREHFRLSREGKIPHVDSKKARVLPHPTWPGYGVFATCNIKEGEIVEYGLQRKIAGLNGDKCPYVFTWNAHGRRRTQAEGLNEWGQGTNSIMFYNSDSPANCRLFRLYGGWRFVVVARCDIAMGEELMHLYKSSSWRRCFVQDECLPKEQPLEVRSRAASQKSSRQSSPKRSPLQDRDVLLNDGQWVISPMALAPPFPDRNEEE